MPIDLTVPHDRYAADQQAQRTHFAGSVEGCPSAGIGRIGRRGPSAVRSPRRRLLPGRSLLFAYAGSYPVTSRGTVHMAGGGGSYAYADPAAGIAFALTKPQLIPTFDTTLSRTELLTDYLAATR